MTEADRIVHYRNVFHGFARVEAPGLDSPMYAELAYGVSLDDELLALAALKRRGQPAPNMLFAAAQYLLLCGVAHPLAAHYPVIAGTPRPPVPAFPLFRDLCLSQRGRIAELLRVRRTQTNEVRRCACLLPALALVAGEASAPLALFDVGASAGLNLNFDRYAYRYRCQGGETLRWGEEDAPVRIDAELRGAGAMPPLPPAIEVASRDGIDLHPVDVQDADQLLWLRALIWPEHEDRHQRLLDAATVLQRSPVRLHAGDVGYPAPGLRSVDPRAPARGGRGGRAAGIAQGGAAGARRGRLLHHHALPVLAGTTAPPEGCAQSCEPGADGVADRVGGRRHANAFDHPPPPRRGKHHGARESVTAWLVDGLVKLPARAPTPLTALEQLRKQRLRRHS